MILCQGNFGEFLWNYAPNSSQTVRDVTGCSLKKCCCCCCCCCCCRSPQLSAAGVCVGAAGLCGWWGPSPSEVTTQKFTQNSGGTDWLQRVQWLQQNKKEELGSPSLGHRFRRLAGPLKVESVVFPGSLMETERDWERPHCICSFPQRLCNSALTAPRQRSRESERGKEGGRRDTGLQQERGVLYPKRQSLGAVWVWCEWMIRFRGGWAPALQNQLV